MGERNSVGAWDGGYIRKDARGRRVYIICKRVDGRLYEVSTRCTSSAAAEEQWRRFQANPAAYEPGGTARADALELDEKLITLFLAWSRDEQRNSRTWVGSQRRMLVKFWLPALAGKDLRRLTLEGDVLPALDGAKARAHKIAVLKVLFTWLTTVRRLLKPSEDPTFRALKVPQARPEQWKRVKSFSQAEYLKIRERLVVAAPARSGRPCSFIGCTRPRFAKELCAGHYQQRRKGWHLEPLHNPGEAWPDLLDCLAATGWHVNELVRFARAGEIIRIEGRGPVLESPSSKSGEPLRTEVSEDVATIAERVLRRGAFSRSRFDAAVREAARAAGVRVRTGTFRHAVATWAINKGTSAAAVSAFLVHKSERTTRRFYATHGVPAKVPTLK
jgi:integrase